MAEAARRVLQVPFPLLMVAVLQPCQGELCPEDHDVPPGHVPCQPCLDCPGSFGWNSTQNSSLAAWLSPQSSSTFRFALLVPIFCILGLAGVFLCESLTMKARRQLRSSNQKDVEAMGGLSGEISGNSEDHLTNEDTIGMLVRYFMRSKGNLAVLRALAREQDGKESGDSFISWTLQPSPCFHHPHTVHVWPDLTASPHSSHIHRCIPVSPFSARHITQIHGAPCRGNQLAIGHVQSVGRFRVASIPDGKSQFIPSEGDTERQLCTLQDFHIPEHLLGHNSETQDVCHDDVTLIFAEQSEGL